MPSPEKFIETLKLFEIQDEIVEWIIHIRAIFSFCTCTPFAKTLQTISAV